MNLWKYDSDDILGERKEVRIKRFREMGEDVCVFFWKQLKKQDLNIEKDNGKCPVKLWME